MAISRFALAVALFALGVTGCGGSPATGSTPRHSEVDLLRADPQEAALAVQEHQATRAKEPDSVASLLRDMERITAPRPSLGLDLETEVRHLNKVTDAILIHNDLDAAFLSYGLNGDDFAAYWSQPLQIHVRYNLDKSKKISEVTLSLDLYRLKTARLAKQTDVAIGLLTRYAPKADRASLVKMLAAAADSKDNELDLHRVYGSHRIDIWRSKHSDDHAQRPANINFAVSLRPEAEGDLP